MASIIELLVKVQVLDERQHDAVMSRARSSAGGHLLQQVAEMGYATEGTVARAISVELGLPRIDLGMTPPEPAALSLIDARTCADRFLLPVALRENGVLLWLAMADPTDLEALAVVRRKTQKRVRPAVAGPTEILRALRAQKPAAAPQAAPGRPLDEKLAGLESELRAPAGPFEVVEVADEIEGSALSRIARQLGVEVPSRMPSRREARPPGPPFTFEELFSPAVRPASPAAGDLSAADLASIEALRASMEKGALVLRSLAQLCLEKGVFTREEMKRKHPKG